MEKHSKAVHVTASTGMACLQFKKGHTIHSWSGYRDGHVPIANLLPEIKNSNNYSISRNWILNAEVLVIDEVGLLSAKVIEEVELICRHLKGNDKVFSGLQVIAAGSFVQLPPVPSLDDQGKYAFETDIFKKIFPHRIILRQVYRQKQYDLIQSINELCEGHPTKTTHELMQSLKRPLHDMTDAIHIFGTNFEVDFFNAMTLKSVNYPEKTFLAKDFGDTTKLRKCVVPKSLVLKQSNSGVQSGQWIG